MHRVEVRKLMPRITLTGYSADPRGTDLSPDEPDLVRIRLKNGERHEITIGPVPGGSFRLLSERELNAKLRQCADGVIGEASANELALTLGDLAQLPDVHAVTRHFLGRS